MKRKIITIDEQGTVIVPSNGVVRMTEYEIARLFEVTESAIRANIKVIIRSGVIKPDLDRELVPMGKMLLPILYGLEMVTALAFRINSRNTKLLREWLMRKITASPIVIKITNTSITKGKQHLN